LPSAGEAGAAGAADDDCAAATLRSPAGAFGVPVPDPAPEHPTSTTAEANATVAVRNERAGDGRCSLATVAASAAHVERFAGVPTPSKPALIEVARSWVVVDVFMNASLAQADG